MTLILGIFLTYSLFTWIVPVLIRPLLLINRFKPHSQTQSSVSDSESLSPPVLNIPYEATNTASIKIKGYAPPHTKIELFVDDSLDQTTTSQDDGSFLVENLHLVLGVNNINGKTVDEKGNKSLPSKSIRVVYDNKKPKLEIQSPTDNQVIKGGDKKVAVSGSTDPGDNLSVNNIKLIVDSEGKFSKIIDLSDGDNTLTITSSDLAGNSTTKTKKVTYQN